MARRVKRLYESFHPDNYVISISIDEAKTNFSGTVTIDGQKVGRPSKRITLHQKGLRLKKAKVTHHSKGGLFDVALDRVNTHKSLDELRLHSKQNIYAGRYSIEVEFSGKISPQLHGIYASKFKHGKIEHTIVCTQFESHSAREAFPCIDEPEAKAVFNLSLDTPINLSTVLSNTDPLSQETKNGRKLTKFAPTPKMSSYLLAFVAGELNYLEAKTNIGVRVRTYATPANAKFTKFALETAVKTLEFYDEYFAIAYPLTKCDFIALPDFAAGAMENWGCITSREKSLLVDPDNTSLELKQYVVNVITHELTHQWFGNLVTMRWWTDIWLNESFASWMSELAIDHLFPDWKTWTQFIVEDQAVGLKLDSLEHTHPVEEVISQPDEIRTIFDAISYDKGASVISMLHDYIGKDSFRDGIRLYLSQHLYGNTDTVDLWQALESVSSKPVTQFISHWTLKSGYPLVKVSYQEDSLLLKQQRFYLNPLAAKQPAVWPVPLFSSIDLGSNNPFSRRSLTITLDSQPTSYLMNRGHKGFYRVIYDDDTLKRVFDDRFMDKVEEVDRVGLLADSVEASKAGYSKSISTLNLLEHYRDETSLVVWQVMAGYIGAIRLNMDDESLRQQMKPFIRQQVNSELNRLGWEAKPNESHFDQLLRPIILGLGASADEPKVLRETKELFYSGENIDPSIRGVVYTTIARHGHQGDYDLLLKMYLETDSSEEKVKLASALNSFKQSKIISQALKLINSDIVRFQDVIYWIGYAFSNYYGRDAAWKWLMSNWDWLETRIGEDLNFYRLVSIIAHCYSSLEFLEEFKSFFEKHLSPGLDRPLKQAIETIQWQAEWRSRDLEEIRKFFNH